MTLLHLRTGELSNQAQSLLGGSHYLEFVYYMWKRLEETYERTSIAKSVKLYIYKDKFAKFTMQDVESIAEMTQLNCK